MPRLSSLRYFGLCLCLLTLSACGGGKNNSTATTSTQSSLVFTASSPSDATPPAQTFDVTFGPGTVYLAVNHDGVVLQNLTYTLNGDTATITATPAAPSTIGSGIFTSNIVVTGYRCADAGCTQMTPGNTQTIVATYTIPPDVQYVGPYVGTPNTSQQVILRGEGFSSFPVNGVQFGTTAATSFSVVNDTEIKASYPAMAAGTYPVTVTLATANVPTSQANLILQTPPTPPSAPVAITYSNTTAVNRLLYDPQRQALLVARTTSSGQEIDRYAYASGSWGTTPTATSNAISGLADIALSADGQQLLTLSQTDISPLDPSTLLASATGTPVTAPALANSDTYKNLVVTNNNNAVVTTGYPGSSNTPTYIYSVANGTFSQPVGTQTNPVGTPVLNNATPGVSTDGSLVVLPQGYPGVGASSIYTFSPDSMTFQVASNQSINQNTVLPALDRNATTVILNGTNVYQPEFIPGTPPVVRVTLDFNLLGTLPTTTEAAVLSPDGSTAYTLDTSTTPPQILKFDLTQTPTTGVGGAYQSVSTTTLTSDPGSGAQMVISPDGGTLFIAGDSQIVVLPTP